MFTTDFDEILPSPSVPVVVDRGGHEALRVTDQFHRRTKCVGRFVAPGLVGLKVAARGRALRLRMRLSADELSAPGWQARNLPGENVIDPLPRLIRVRVQGRAQQHLILMRRPGLRTPCGHVAFDLRPDEVPDDGLLFVEVLDVLTDRVTPAAVRGALDGAFLESGTAGLRIDWIRVEEPEPPALSHMDGATSENAAITSSGGLRRKGRPSTPAVSANLLVVNPTGAELTLRLSAAADPTGKTHRLRRMARNLLPCPPPRVRRAISLADGSPAEITSRVAGDAVHLRVAGPSPSSILVVFERRGGVVPFHLETQCVQA